MDRQTQDPRQDVLRHWKCTAEGINIWTRPDNRLKVARRPVHRARVYRVPSLQGLGHRIALYRCEQHYVQLVIAMEESGRRSQCRNALKRFQRRLIVPGNAAPDHKKFFEFAKLGDPEHRADFVHPVVVTECLVDGRSGGHSVAAKASGKIGESVVVRCNHAAFRSRHRLRRIKGEGSGVGQATGFSPVPLSAMSVRCVFDEKKVAHLAKLTNPFGFRADHSSNVDYNDPSRAVSKAMSDLLKSET